MVIISPYPKKPQSNLNHFCFSLIGYSKPARWFLCQRLWQGIWKIHPNSTPWTMHVSDSSNIKYFVKDKKIIVILWYCITVYVIYLRYPSAPCSYIDSTKLSSQCLQKHNFVRLLAYTYDLGLHIDSFKMPVACSCHIRGPPKHYG